nr:MAG TPA: hypothetical protein [Bacteriophage sp.]
MCWTPFSAYANYSSVTHVHIKQCTPTNGYFSRIITEPPFIILAGGEMPSVHYIKGENNYEYNSNYNIQ